MIDQVSVDYQLSYALEPKPEPPSRQTVKKHQTISGPSLPGYDIEIDKVTASRAMKLRPQAMGEAAHDEGD